MIFQRRHLLTTAGSLAAVVFLCQCETERTVKTRQSSVSFDQGMWGGQAAGSAGEDTKKITQRGYEIDESGNIIADKPNLYADKTMRGSDKTFGKKQARFGNMEAKTKEFKTPEYLVRQDFKTGEAKESGSQAREGGNRNRQAGKLFQTKSKASSDAGSFETGTFDQSGEKYQTNADRVGSAGIASAPIADGSRRTMGFQDNTSMSLDDVKKMVNPGTYARKKEL
jgi:hypothetical protein